MLMAMRNTWMVLLALLMGTQMLLASWLCLGSAWCKDLAAADKLEAS
jgi:hypothetical protein